MLPIAPEYMYLFQVRFLEKIRPSIFNTSSIDWKKQKATIAHLVPVVANCAGKHIDGPWDTIYQSLSKVNLERVLFRIMPTLQFPNEGIDLCTFFLRFASLINHKKQNAFARLIIQTYLDSREDLSLDSEFYRELPITAEKSEVTNMHKKTGNLLTKILAWYHISIVETVRFDGKIHVDVVSHTPYCNLEKAINTALNTIAKVVNDTIEDSESTIALLDTDTNEASLTVTFNDRTTKYVVIANFTEAEEEIAEQE